MRLPLPLTRASVCFEKIGGVATGKSDFFRSAWDDDFIFFFTFGMATIKCIDKFHV